MTNNTFPFYNTSEANNTFPDVLTNEDLGRGEEEEEIALELSQSDQLLLEIERSLKIYYSMLLIIVGTVFNILSILILSRNAFRRTTMSVYLRFLAAADMFTLYNGLSRLFVGGVWDYNIRHLGEGMCKFHRWSTAFAPDLSAWILVAVTSERVLSVAIPHKVRTICSKTTAWASIVLICLVTMASNLPLLFFYGDKRTFDTKTNHTTIVQCTLTTSVQFMDTIWYWIDLTKFILLPSLILLIFNLIIVFFVVVSRRRVQKFTSPTTTSPANRKRNKEHAGDTNDNTERQATQTTRTSSRTARNTSSSHNKAHNQNTNKSNVSGSSKEVSLTLTLLSINVTYIVCNSPISLYLLTGSNWFPPGFPSRERLTLTAAIMAMYTNNAANFLLYCATGSRFRSEIRQWFREIQCCCLRSRSDTSGLRGRSWLASRREKDVSSISGRTAGNVNDGFSAISETGTPNEEG